VVIADIDDVGLVAGDDQVVEGTYLLEPVEVAMEFLDVLPGRVRIDAEISFFSRSTAVRWNASSSRSGAESFRLSDSPLSALPVLASCISPGISDGDPEAVARSAAARPNRSRKISRMSGFRRCRDPIFASRASLGRPLSLSTGNRGGGRIRAPVSVAPGYVDGVQVLQERYGVFRVVPGVHEGGDVDGLRVAMLPDAA
jgi:hypothetical protein